MPLISSLHNPRVKNAIRLRDARHRQKQRRIVIDGLRELGRALLGHVELEEVFACPRYCDRPEAQALLAQIPPGVEVHEVTAAVFEKLAFGSRAEGVLGVARMPVRRLADLVLPPNPLLAVLEGLEKPGNIGAVLRSADGAGLSAVIVADARTDLYSPNAIRASLGTIFTLPVVEAAAAEALAWLTGRSIAIYPACVEAAVSYTQADFRGPSAFILGSEAQGLTGLWQGQRGCPIRLPMQGLADSLNVSATAAVLFYEALRQRQSLIP